MDTPILDPLTYELQAASERHRRIALEARSIADARAEIEAGLFVEEAAVDAWIDSIGTAQELPVPLPNQ